MGAASGFLIGKLISLPTSFSHSIMSNLQPLQPLAHGSMPSKIPYVLVDGLRKVRVWLYELGDGEWMYESMGGYSLDEVDVGLLSSELDGLWAVATSSELVEFPGFFRTQKCMVTK